MKGQDVGSKFFLGVHLNYEAIAIFAEAMALDKEDTVPTDIRNHVEGCQQCKKEIFAIYKLIKDDSLVYDKESYSSFNDLLPKKGRKIKFNVYNFLKIAAVLLIIIGVSILVTYLISSKNSKFITKYQTVDSLKRPDKTVESQNLRGETIVSSSEMHLQKDNSNNSSVKNNELALNMQESEIFENILASHYRSSDIEVLSPILKQQFSTKQKIVFKFKGDTSVPFLVKIYNNRGEKIFAKDDISTLYYPLETRLSPGIYYWKLEREDNLLYVGKFFIK